MISFNNFCNCIELRNHSLQYILSSDSCVQLVVHHCWFTFRTSIWLHKVILCWHATGTQYTMEIKKADAAFFADKENGSLHAACGSNVITSKAVFAPSSFIKGNMINGEMQAIYSEGEFYM